MFSEDVLIKDKITAQVDFIKKKRDVSYLMETSSYHKGKQINDFVADNINKSVNLLSSDTQSSLISKNNQVPHSVEPLVSLNICYLLIEIERSNR